LMHHSKISSNLVNLHLQLFGARFEFTAGKLQALKP
jgi:hypothetical protein